MGGAAAANRRLADMGLTSNTVVSVLRAAPLGDPVEMMTNVKMNLVDVDENLSARNFYGKVIKRSRENGPTHVIHFTSIPPEINAYFNAFRQHAAT